jgi:hypothetical protein
MKQVETPAWVQGWQGLVGGDPQTLTTGSGTKIAFDEMSPNAMLIGAHPKDHRYYLIDGQSCEPIVEDAPGRQRRDRQRQRGGELMAELVEHFPIKSALGDRRIEVDLERPNAGEGAELGDSRGGPVALRGGEVRWLPPICRDPYHRHELRVRRRAERLESRADDDIRSDEVERTGEEGDADRPWIDEIQ